MTAPTSDNSVIQHHRSSAKLARSFDPPPLAFQDLFDINSFNTCMQPSKNPKSQQAIRLDPTAIARHQQHPSRTSETQRFGDVRLPLHQQTGSYVYLQLVRHLVDNIMQVLTIALVSVTSTCTHIISKHILCDHDVFSGRFDFNFGAFRSLRRGLAAEHVQENSEKYSLSSVMYASNVAFFSMTRSDSLLWTRLL